METFEITRTGLQRQPSIGPAPGAKVVPWLLAIVFIILTTGIILLLMGTVLSYKRFSAERSAFLKNNAEKLQSEQCEKKYCDSKDCIRMALRITELMNPRADPCSDFYEYACGGISKPRSFPPKQHPYYSISDTHFEILTKIRSVLEESRLSNDESETLKKMKQLYRSCIDTDTRKNSSSQALEYWFSDLQLPLSSLDSPGSMELDSRGSWRKLVSRLEEFRIHTIIEPSFKSSSSDPIETIELNCVMPTLPLHTYLHPAENESVYRFRLYKTVMFNVLGKLKMSMADKAEFYRDVIEMETDVATTMQGFQPSRKSELSEEHTNQMRDLWRVMLGDIVQDINVVSVCKYNLDEVLSTLNRSPYKRAARYVIWRMLAQVLPFLGEDLQKLHKHFLSQWLPPDLAFDSPWSECSEFLRKELGLAVFKELTESGRIRKKTARDIKFLALLGKGHLLQSLRNCNWIDSPLKEYLINKVKEMVFNPGFSELIFQTETADIIYSDLKLEDDYFHSVMSIKKFKTRKSLDRLWYGNSENPMSEISLDDNPLGFSSQFDYVKNVVHLNYGLLIPPTFLYTRLIPKYLKFGELSLLIREMSHVFDATGILGISDVQHRSILQQKYNEYAECLLNQTQLSQSFPHNEAFKKQFLNDFIADHGSFQFLFKGFHSHLRNQQINELKIPGIPLTKMQTYFIQVVQQYCKPTTPDSSNLNENYGISSRFRINLAVSNMENFGNSFNCPRSKPLNPYTKCQLF